MNRNLYNILRFIPIVGTIVKFKCNYFATHPTIIGGVNVRDGSNYKILMAWCEAHPDQVLSPKKAAELIGQARK